MVDLKALFSSSRQLVDIKTSSHHSSPILPQYTVCGKGVIKTKDMLEVLNCFLCFLLLGKWKQMLSL